MSSADKTTIVSVCTLVVVSLVSSADKTTIVSVCTLVVVALVSSADKTTTVWYVAKSQFHKHIHTMHNRQYPEARPGALHAFILRPNNPNNALSATAAQYAGPQTNRLTVKVAVKAAKAACPQLAVSCSTEHDRNLRNLCRRSVCARTRPPGRPASNKNGVVLCLL